jgi:Fic family protein
MKKESYKPAYTITSKILKLTSDISEAITKIELDQNFKISPKLRRENQVKTLAGTLEIEGNYLGEEKITALLDGKRVLGTNMELAEVEGTINAYKLLEQYKCYKQEDLLKAHSLLMRGILESAGSFRTVRVVVGEHIPPIPMILPHLMDELFEWLETSDEHPLIKSCVFHYEFEYIHPFLDGNGRIGRLWQSVILYQWRSIFSSLPTESLIRDNQKAYYDALQVSNIMGESTAFIEFMLEVILSTIDNVPKIVIENVPNDRTFMILKYMMNDSTVTIKVLAEHLKVNEKTIKRDIEKLKEEGKVVRTGSARKGVWQVII